MVKKTTGQITIETARTLEPQSRKDAMISFCVDTELKEQITEWANTLGVTRSAMYRAIFSTGVPTQEDVNRASQ